MKLKHILILQNKIDLVKESQAKDQYEQILKFVQGMVTGCSLNGIWTVTSEILFRRHRGRRRSRYPNLGSA